MKTNKLFTGFELKADDSDEGSFTGLASVFGNVDLGGDVVAKGAFNRSLREAQRVKRMPRFLLHHDPRQVAGVFTKMEETDTGLEVEGRFNLEKQSAREAFADLKMGAIDGLSIGFITRRATRDDKTGIRTIKEADLMEVSLVTFPMNEEARIGGVKSIADQITTIREFEDYLRDAGFSAQAAKSIASSGFKESERRDDAQDETLQALKQLAQSLKL